jgi:putative inorganic carbon (HCO3(-)) transporter
MIRRPATAPAIARRFPGIDRRIWWMVTAIGLFAVLVVKEVQLPPSVMLGFGIVGLTGLFMTGLQDPVIPLYMLIAYLPFSRILVGDFGTQAVALNMTNILMLLVLFAYVVHQLSQHRRIGDRMPFNALVWTFCLLGTVALLRAGWEYGSWYVTEFIIPLKRWLTPMAMYFLTLNIARERRSTKAVVVIIMVAVTIVGAMASYDYFQNADASFDKARVGGIAEQPNTLGAFFDYYMFLLAGFFLVYWRNGRAWLLLLPLLICFRGIMVTFSRGAYLGFAAGVIGACFFHSKRLMVALVTTVLVTIFITPVLIPEGIRYRMGMTVRDPTAAWTEGDLAETLETSAATRIQVWRGAVQMIKEHPMWGVGYGAFPQFIHSYAPENAHLGYIDAHNSYLLIAAEMGIPTLLVFLLIVAAAGYYTYWLYRHTQDQFFKATALGFLAGLCGLLVANMFGSRMDDQAVASYFWVLCGVVMRAVLMEWEAQGPARRRRLKAVMPEIVGSVRPSRRMTSP